MINTVSVTQAQAELPRLLRSLARSGPVKITRNDQPPAYLVESNFLESILETLELAGNAKFSAALARERSGKAGKSFTLAELDALDED